MVIVFVQHPHYLELQNMAKNSVEYTKDFVGKMVESLVTKLSSLRDTIF